MNLRSHYPYWLLKQGIIRSCPSLEKDILEKYGFKSPAGLLSKDGAEVDAYNLTHTLLHKSKTKALKVYDHTAIQKINYKKDHVELLTEADHVIKARKLVTACG